jgi:hypothetical protein
MIFKNLKYFLFILFVLLQGIIILVLFKKSLDIDGDILSYLKIMGGDINFEYDIEPFSLIVFKVIGLFPIKNHFLILYLFIFALCIIESWIIFKETKGSLLWIIFFTFVIVPFFHAINLRTGFGMFFFLLFYNYTWSLILTPFFHTSFFPLLSGFKAKISFKTLVVLFILAIVISSEMFVLISGKLESYYGYYTEDESVAGVLVEIFLLGIFFFIMKKKYKLNSNILWYRVFFFVLLIAAISFRIAIVSSRFITLAYLIILIVRLNSKKIEKMKALTIVNILFFSFFFMLIVFRIYRVFTMFGFSSI